jgi:hypothetical protein
MPMPSTAIRRMQYDPERRTLSVWFVPSGHRYDYADVPAELYDVFRQSGSKGRFFNARIRDRFAYVQVEDDAAPAAEPNFSTVAKLYPGTVTRG